VPGPAGKRQQRTKNFENAKDSKAFAARQTTEVERKGVGDPHRRSFGSYLKSWLATLRDRVRGELVGVAFDAIDMANATITIKRAVIEARVDGMRVRIVRPIAKTKASLRTFSIARELVDMLIEHRKRLLATALALGPTFAREPLYLFPGTDGLPIMPYLMTQRLDAVRKRAGVKGVDPVQGFRHAHATILLASGTNPVVVSKRLGHSSPAVTLSVYAHALPQSDQAAAESVAHLIRRSGPNEA
jgi:integrase